MPPSDNSTFGPFDLDLVSACLRRGETVVPMRRQTFRVLHYLVEHAHQLRHP